MKDSLREPRCVCARCDVPTHKKKLNMRAHSQTMWKSVKMVMSSLVFASCSVTTQSWTIVNMLSLVSESCFVTTHSWPILNFPLLVPISSWSQFQLVTCSQFQLVVKLYELIVTFSCSHLVHTLAPRKHVVRGVVFTPAERIRGNAPLPLPVILRCSCPLFAAILLDFNLSVGAMPTA